jgi:hypothetical protein
MRRSGGRKAERQHADSKSKSLHIIPHVDPLAADSADSIKAELPTERLALAAICANGATSQ